jgi:hypothetical protein
MRLARSPPCAPGQRGGHHRRGGLCALPGSEEGDRRPAPGDAGHPGGAARDRRGALHRGQPGGVRGGSPARTEGFVALVARRRTAVRLSESDGWQAGLAPEGRGISWRRGRRGWNGRFHGWQGGLASGGEVGYRSRMSTPLRAHMTRAQREGRSGWGRLLRAMVHLWLLVVTPPCLFGACTGGAPVAASTNCCGSVYGAPDYDPGNCALNKAYACLCHRVAAVAAVAEGTVTGAH